MNRDGDDRGVLEIRHGGRRIVVIEGFGDRKNLAVDAGRNRTATLRHWARHFAGGKATSPQDVKLDASGFLDQARDPHQNDCPDESHDNGADHSAALPDAEHSEDPAAENASEDTEDDVHNHAVAAALHHLSSKPAGDQSNYDPYQESHSTLLVAACHGQRTVHLLGTNCNASSGATIKPVVCCYSELTQERSQRG